jgi:dihydroneopterin aldolase/2-amino-4-hydroxy-6-hydroxymethyldihydropteridine diphosphokinase
MDRILIEDLRVLTVIGALPHEREAAQPLRIDLSIGVDLHDAGATDDLDATVHYGMVAEQVVAAAEASRHVLLERMAAEIADIVLAFDRVEVVDVLVTKLRPPVASPLGTTAVRMVRTRAEATSLRPGSQAKSHEAILALGSNLGDREGFLRRAVRELGGMVSGSVVAMSDVYETDPAGGPDEQGAYLNMVVKVDTLLDPFALLRLCHRVEASAHRERLVHWGPRTLDVDLLFYDDAHIDSDVLTVPHPRIAERRFVLTPLSDVAPERCPAGWDAKLPPAVVVSRGQLAL